MEGVIGKAGRKKRGGLGDFEKNKTCWVLGGVFGLFS